MSLSSGTPPGKAHLLTLHLCLHAPHLVMRCFNILKEFQLRLPNAHSRYMCREEKSAYALHIHAFAFRPLLYSCIMIFMAKMLMVSLISSNRCQLHHSACMPA